MGNHQKYCLEMGNHQELSQQGRWWWRGEKHRKCLSQERQQHSARVLKGQGATKHSSQWRQEGMGQDALVQIMLSGYGRGFKLVSLSAQGKEISHVGSNHIYQCWNAVKIKETRKASWKLNCFLYQTAHSQLMWTISKNMTVSKLAIFVSGDNLSVRPHCSKTQTQVAA